MVNLSLERIILLLFAISIGIFDVESFSPIGRIQHFRSLSSSSYTSLMAINKPSLGSSTASTSPPYSSNRKKKKKPVAFKHLFRHHDDISMDCWLRCLEPHAFLVSCGYTPDEIENLVKEFPKLLDKDVHDHLAPHIRFLVRSLGGGSGDLIWAAEENNSDSTEEATETSKEDEDEECLVELEDDNHERHQLSVSDIAKKVVPASFFNIRLEKALAPWHAYLTWQESIPSGYDLLLEQQEENGNSKLRQFLDVCSTSKIEKFVELCNAWDTTGKQHSLEEISEFQYAFHEGLVPAVRNHLHANTKCDPGQMVELLLHHGANHLEDDHYGASLLHWAAGTGNIRAVHALIQAGKDDGIPVKEIIAQDHTSKDGATPLHWAASGVTWEGVFGGSGGGHTDICRLLLDLAGNDLSKETTYTHNSPLEWAAWAGSLDVVKLFVEEYGADAHFSSENGNAAHWACAGGSLPVCQYLADTCGVDFTLTNDAKGWTPLDLASSEGHVEVKEWLMNRFYSGSEKKDKELEGHEELFGEVLSQETYYKNSTSPPFVVRKE